jgi:predicted kinase
MNLDAWMVELFRPDRPQENLWAWYAERTRRCIEQIWSLTLSLSAVDVSVVLELGLLRRRERTAFLQRVEESGHPLTLYVLDAPRDTRRERVVRRNQEQGETFAMVVPLDVFELASDMWEPLEDEECRGRDVRFVVTGTR